MILTPLKTDRISANQITLTEVLDKFVTDMPEFSVLAITSKIVSLCEGSIVPIEGNDKQALVRANSDQFMAHPEGIWGINFTVTDNILIPNAGIDESNADGVYVIWPRDAQATANAVRAYLVERFGHGNIGVVITDSTVRPLRRGVSGIAMAYSGFAPLHDYVGQPDLFGRPFKVSQADIVGGLAAAAVLIMGEGTECTPLALISDARNLTFVDHDPESDELAELRFPIEEDLFGPFLTKIEWQNGRQK